MERYKGSRDMAVVFGFYGALLMAPVLYAAAHVNQKILNLKLFPAAVMLVVFGGLGTVGLLLLRSAAEAFACFFVDDEGITRRAWGRTRSLAWREVVRLEETGMSGPKGKARARGLCVLHGSGGRRLMIGFGYLAQGARLRERLEPQLASLRAETLCSLARDGGWFPICRTIGMCVLLGIAPLCLLNGLAMFDPDISSQVVSSRSWKGFCIVSLAAGWALVALGADLVSRTLEVSPKGLTLRSVFLNRTIPFDRIVSIDVAPLDVFEIHERAKIRGDDGRTITLDSGMPSYRAVLEMVRLRASTKPRGASVGDPEFA